MHFPLTPDQQSFLMFLLGKEIGTTIRDQDETDDPAQKDKLHYHKVRVMELAKIFGHGTGMRQRSGLSRQMKSCGTWRQNEYQTR